MKQCLLTLLIALLACTSGATPLQCPNLPGQWRKSPSTASDLLQKAGRACTKANPCACWTAARLALAAGREQLAEPWLRQACDSQVTPACHELGRVELSYNRVFTAATHLRSACEEKTSELCTASETATKLVAEIGGLIGRYSAACTGGNATVCREVAALVDRYGAANDVPAFLQMGCHLGDEESCVKNSMRELSATEAFPLRKKRDECQAGQSASCYLILTAPLTAAEQQEALSRVKQNCSANNNNFACLQLANYLSRKNQEQAALPHFRTACLAGHPEGCVEVGKNRERQNDIEEARVFYKKGCDADHAESCEKLGVLLAFHRTLPEAKEPLSLACGWNSAAACAALAKIHQVEANQGERLRYLARACDLGDTTASCPALAATYEKIGEPGVAILVTNLASKPNSTPKK